MALFGNTVALEACPAKTAESVSYTATFLVLGWLLASNYSEVFGTEAANQPFITESALIANIEPSQSNADAELIPTTKSVSLSSNTTDNTATELPYADENLTPSVVADLPVWHANLDLSQLPLPHAALTPLDREEWASHLSIAEEFQAQVSFDLPEIEARYVFEPLFGPELAVNDLSGESTTIREITVTGIEAERSRSRPENIRRPEIPRAYRAADIQRSLILPPRIQALRP